MTVSARPPSKVPFLLFSTLNRFRLFGLLVLSAAVVRYVYQAALSAEEVARRDAASSEIDWDRVEEDPEERMSIRWLGMPRAGGMEGGWIERQLEARFNVELTPVALDSKSYGTRKPLMFAGGDVPDVILESDPMVLQRDAFHGFLLDIPYEVLKKHAPNYMRQVNEHGPIGWLYANWRGKNYGLPTWQQASWSVPGIWRADWLEAVGIHQVPETLEEFEEAFRRFREQDPNRSGRKDTYGLSGDGMSWWWASFQDVFGAYGVIPYGWMEREGELMWGGTLPEAKKALARLRRWYEQGWLDPEFVTDTYGSGRGLDRKILNGVIGYAAYYGNYHQFDASNPTGFSTVVQQLNPEARFVPGKFPAGPEGKRGGRVWGNGGWIIAFGRHLEDRPEKVIRILRMLDEMVADEELYLLTKYGKRGVHWDFRIPEGGGEHSGPSSGIVPLPPYDDPNQANRALLGFYNPGENAELLKKYMDHRQLEFNQTYRKTEWGIPDALGKPDVVPSGGMYIEDLRGLQMKVYAEIIRGDRPLDDFDQFVENWNQRGGDQMTREANALFRQRDEIYRRAGVLK